MTGSTSQRLRHRHGLRSDVRADQWWLPACVVIAAVAVAVRSSVWWVPLGDQALTDLWTHFVGGPHTPLVGGDARYGWNHLGPWLFYLLAIPTRILGGSSRGLLVGAGAINVAATYIIGRAGRTIGGTRLGAALCVMAIIGVLIVPGPRLVDPWNPYIAQLVLFAALVACWAIMLGHTAWLACLVGLCSLAVQAHITFVAPVSALIGLTVGSIVVLRRHPSRLQVTAAALVAVPAWLPALIDLVLPHHHNMYRVARFFATASPGGGGLGTSLRVLLRETGLDADWLGGRPPVGLGDHAFTGGVGFGPGLGLVALTWTIVRAWRRREPSTIALVAIIVTLLAAATVSFAASTGPLYPYLFGWVSIVGMVTTLSPLLAHLASAPHPRHTPLLAWASAVAAAALLTITSVGAAPPRSPLERPGDAHRVAAAAKAASNQLDHHQRYWLVHGSDACNSVFELGVVDQLRRDNVDIVVEPDAYVLFGRALVDPDASRHPRIEVVAPYDTPPFGFVPLVVDDPLTPPATPS